MAAISVIVLAYDRPALLQEALNAIAAQTRPPDEILVIDDASPRPLEQAVVTPAGPFVWHRRERNRGPAANAAWGLAEAAGDYVAMLNDDDLWEPTFLERLAAELDGDREATVAFCDHHVIDAGGTRDTAAADRLSREYGRADLPAGRVEHFAEVALFHKAVASMSFAVARTSAVESRIVAAGGDIWDYFLTVSVVAAGGHGRYVDSRLGSYRQLGSGISASREDLRRNIDHLGREIAAQRLVMALVVPPGPSRAGLHRLAARQLARLVVSGFARAVRERELRLALHYARLATGAVLHPLESPRR